MKELTIEVKITTEHGTARLMAYIEEDEYNEIKVVKLIPSVIHNNPKITNPVNALGLLYNHATNEQVMSQIENHYLADKLEQEMHQ